MSADPATFHLQIPGGFGALGAFTPVEDLAGNQSCLAIANGGVQATGSLVAQAGTDYADPFSVVAPDGTTTVLSVNVGGRATCRGLYVDDCPATTAPLYVETSPSTSQATATLLGGTSQDNCVLYVVGGPGSGGGVLLLKAGGSGATGPLIAFQTATGGNAGSFLADGSWRPPQLADASAVSNSVYYSTTAGKLVYKNAGGTVNPLY